MPYFAGSRAENAPGCACRAASKVEYLLILAVVSIAAVGSATLFGRRISRFFETTAQSVDQGTPIDSTLQFPSKVAEDGATPKGSFPGPNPENDYTQFYQSLLGDTKPVVDVIDGNVRLLDDLPSSIALPTNLKEQMRAGRRGTNKDGFERGANVRGQNGNIVFGNPGRGREPTPREKEEGAGAAIQVRRDDGDLGNFHSHPDLKHFSHVDLMSLAEDAGDKLKLLELANGKQWVIVRTKDTHPQLTAESVNDCYARAFRNKFSSYLNQAGGDIGLLGNLAPPMKDFSEMGVAEIILHAAAIAAHAGTRLPEDTNPLMEAMTEAGTMAVVKALGFGAYRGQNCEPLGRVDNKD